MDNFYKGKKILITGNTGFKGSWITQMLLLMGADVTGIALEPVTDPNLYELLNQRQNINEYIADIRDYDRLLRIFKAEKPEIVFHLAAQPIVLESYRNPRNTYDVNVMGTVNVCECIRNTECVSSFVNVTTDKVYLNNEWEFPYRETDWLDGYEPYSNSKSCSELVTASYIRSFFGERQIAVSTCRAGNVIGGGDFSEFRIIPDCFRDTVAGRKIAVRNPDSVRPYQHILEAISFYIMVAERQMQDKAFAGSYNVGPEYLDCLKRGMSVSFSVRFGATMRHGKRQIRRDKPMRQIFCGLILQKQNPDLAGDRLGMQDGRLRKPCSGTRRLRRVRI